MKIGVAVLTTLVMTICIAALSNAANEEEVFAVSSFTENVTLSGALEAEVGYAKDFEDVDTSDIALATMELGIDLTLSELCSGHLLLLWEEDDTEPADLDDAYITVGGTEDHAMYLRVGKLYVPFGMYESNMISGPLTSDLGETRESAVVFGTEYKGFNGALYVFNGDVEKENSDDVIETFGIRAGYTFSNENFNLDIGAGWISNVMDSDGMQDAFFEHQSGFVEVNPSGIFELVDDVAGFAAHVIMTIGQIDIIGEYVGYIDEPEYRTVDDLGNVGVENPEQSPSVFHIECANTFEVLEKEMTVAATYQGTEDLSGILPEMRYGASAGLALSDMLGIAVEYIHDEDYDENDGGTNSDAEAYTMQFALTF